MATLLLTAVGTVFGGPFCGALGALAGRQIDGQIFGNGRPSEGPRLKDLQVSTSSYGQPIPRHFGRVRTAGTIIWATDLIENRETASGGKGQPKSTTFSYSASFAIALSSRPITGIGKIWADGNLLRGPDGALSSPGTLRIYYGAGDQPVDPLIAAAEGSRAPACRGTAYVVFDNLELADFGNRIPALTFEVFADTGELSGADMIGGLDLAVDASATFPKLVGYSHESGSVRSMLATLDNVYPLACNIDGPGLRIASRATASGASVPVLSEPASMMDVENPREPGDDSSHRRVTRSTPAARALRYYDIDRDYQPGMQRAAGRADDGQSRTLEFPGTLAAADAAKLADNAVRNARSLRETIRWRVAEIDPAIAPGSIVRVPGHTGLWLVESWEWTEAGVEFDLSRAPPAPSATISADAGNPVLPPIQLPWPTWFMAFELPWDGRGSSADRTIYTATSAGGANWRGASLYRVDGMALQPVGTAGRARSTVGTIVGDLALSLALRFESAAWVQVELLAEDMVLQSASLEAIAGGANRIYCGGEIIQFAHATQTGPQSWRLDGLLRGRGGTEAIALRGHPAQTPFVLLDDTIERLDPAVIPADGSVELAAIGRFDDEPVYASIENIRIGRKPLMPVHPRVAKRIDGSVDLSWTRRARGNWIWADEIDAPLIESREQYRVGLGDVSSPVLQWEVTEPSLTLAGSQWNALAADHPGRMIWVCQIGDFARSDPLSITTISV